MRYSALKSEPLSSMRNTLRLLNLFTMDEPELNLSELAEKLEIGISTAYRLTAALMQEGFLAKDPVSKRFRLGASILGMGSIITAQFELCRFSAPVLEKLAAESGESAHLSIMKGNQVIYLQKVDSTHHVHLLSHIGRQNPVHCTSTGQVILAYQTDSLIDQVIGQGLPPYTAKTVTSPQKFKELLSAVRKQGYALSVEEMHMGISSIAAPVHEPSGQVTASVSIAGPASRIHLHKAPKLVQLVRKAADDISASLGR